METIETSLVDAVTSNQIESFTLEGRSKNGTQYSKCFGTRTLADGSKKDLSPSDLLFLASGTKLLTTIATLQCCEKGLLSLDEDLRSKWPQWFDRKVLVKWDENDAEPTYEDMKKPVTLRHLLTHSSGFVYYFLNPAITRWQAANPPPTDGSIVDVPNRFGTPLAFQPGEGWMYGSGLDWAGHLVETVSGMKLDEYFRAHLLKPLGIPETDLSFHPVKEGLGDRMPGLNPQDPKGEGKSEGGGHTLFIEGDTTCYGGHGAYANSGAYVTVLHSIVADDGKLLKSSSVAEICKPQLEAAAKKSLQAVLENPSTSFFDQGTTIANSDYGFSGLLVTGDGDKSGMGKGAMTWGGGVNSIWVLDPGNGVCGFAAPQLGLPADVAKATELKTVFTREIKNLK